VAAYAALGHAKLVHLFFAGVIPLKLLEVYSAARETLSNGWVMEKSQKETYNGGLTRRGRSDQPCVADISDVRPSVHPSVCAHTMYVSENLNL